MALSAQQAVVLIHGLWMGNWCFFAIDKYLKKQGYKVYRFNYGTTSKPLDFNVMKLQAFVNSRPESIVHLVGHSMGGLLSMFSLPKINKKGKLVMLGSPVNGSQAAKRLNQRWWSCKLLKHASKTLEHGINNPQYLRHSCMIAGISGHISLSRLVTKLPRPHDGTVALVETQAEWINQHHCEKANHFSMLYRKKVLTKIHDFLMDQTTNTIKENNHE